MYVVSSHMDKPLETAIPNSKFEIPIQAGAALTDRRICEVNDHDGFAESISAENKRYCEGTAIYWIGRHLDSDYVGVEHYRRRFLLSDKELEALLDQGVDVITTKPMPAEQSIRMDYVKDHYGGDWMAMMSLLKKHDPDHYDLYEKEAEGTQFHYGSINIMKQELFRLYCDWMFPIAREFSGITPLKTDSYNGRDTAFIMERLSHFFVMRMKAEGKNVVERGILTPLTYKEIAGDHIPEGYMDYTKSVYEAASVIHYMGGTKPWKKDRTPSEVYDLFDRAFFLTDERLV